MPVTKIPIDGLWRCLCPSIDYLAITHVVVPLASVRKLPNHLHLRNSSSRVQRFHISAPARFEGTQHLVQTNESSSPNDVPLDSPIAERSIRELNDTPRSILFNTVSGPSSRPGLLGERSFERYHSLDDVASVHLHERLRHNGTESDEYQRVAELVEYLIMERGEKPGPIHYEALIKVNADAENGSAATVEGLLIDMKKAGINADSGTYHAALQALAIHPSYLLRNQIIQEMKERWIGLSPDGWHSLVVGLLRDRQFESAMETLEQMQSDEIHVQPWLYDIFMYQLCEIGEMDEAYRVLRYRFDNRRKEILHSMWYYLLDKFSSNYHYQGTKFVWNARVTTSQVVPSDGICVSALNLAARKGDPGLATSAIRILSSRRSALSPFHYESLLAAYAKAEDFNTSFRILVIMAKAGLEPDSNTTRPLFILLSQSPSFADSAWQSLISLHKDGHVIPPAAVNVVIETQTHLGKFNQAVDLYKESHRISRNGPNAETFNILLQGMRQSSNKSMAMFFASEMRALRVKPDRLTYDRFILICLEEEDYEDAFNYLDEMMVVGINKDDDGQKGWWMRHGTAIALVQKCAKAGDHRAWDLLTEMEKRDIDQGRLRKWVEKNFRGKQLAQERMNKKLAQW